MTVVGELLKILGGLAGIIALVWRLVDEFGGWLRIAVKVDPPKSGVFSALTTVDNKGNRSKPIEFACLLIGPESEDPVVTISTIAASLGLTEPVGQTEHVTRLQRLLSATAYCDGRAIVPLPFYYDEQIAIADETLTYRATLRSDRFAAGATYSVRFFIFVTGRFHRSTHDSFLNIEEMKR